MTLGSFAGLRDDYNDKGEPVLVGLRGDAIVPVPLPVALEKHKRVGPDDPLVRVARAVKTSFGDEASA